MSNGSQPNFDRIYLFVGKISVSWVEIDYLLSSLLVRLSTSIESLEDLPERTQRQSIVVREMDTRSKAKALRAVAQFIPAEGVQNRLLAAVNRVDNELRTKRNRIVHDDWIPTDLGFSARQYTSSLTREPGSGSRIWQNFRDTHYLSEQELEETESEFAAVIDELSDLRSQITFYALHGGGDAFLFDADPR